MHEYDFHHNGKTRFQNVLGFCLLALGIIGGCWIAASVVGFITDPAAVSLVQALSSAAAPDRSMTIAGQPVVLAKTMLQATGMFLFLVVMGIAAGVVRTFIAGGVNLLQHDVNRLVRFLDNAARAREHSRE